MIVITGGPGLAIFVFICVIFAVGYCIAQDHKKRKAGVPGVPPFWASPSAIIPSLLVLIFCMGIGIPVWLAFSAYVVYAICVGYTVSKVKKQQ